MSISQSQKGEKTSKNQKKSPQMFKKQQQVDKQIHRDQNDQVEQNGWIKADPSDMFDALRSENYNISYRQVSNDDQQLTKSKLKQLEQEQNKPEEEQQSLERQKNNITQQNWDKQEKYEEISLLEKIQANQNQQTAIDKQQPKQEINKQEFQSMIASDYGLLPNEDQQTQKNVENRSKKLQNPPNLNRNYKLIQSFTQETFSKYLSQQIQKMEQSSSLSKARMSQALKNPVLFRNLSRRSDDSPTFTYQPQLYASNFSRCYIPNFQSLSDPTIYESSIYDSKESILKKFKLIFNHYSEVYLQMAKGYENFDEVKSRTLSFQAFSLFAKDFKFLKTIFSLDTIKRLYNKHSEFGKQLKHENFISLMQGLAHEKQSNDYFKIEKTVPGMSAEIRNQVEIRQFYLYLGIYTSQKKIKEKFSKVFHAFGCQKDCQLPKIKYNYRSFSERDLHKKALPDPRQKKSRRSVVVIKSNQKFEPTPFEDAKSLVVSWQLFKSKSTDKLKSLKRSSDMVKKYVKQDPEDKIYLNQYAQTQRKSAQRQLIERKIKQIKQIKQKKNNSILQKMQAKISATKVKFQKEILSRRI